MAHDWKSALDQGVAVRVVLVDFKKAFDFFNHNTLLNKLYEKNIPHCLIKWLVSYLQHRTQRVHLGSDLSSWLWLNGAIPRARPLSFLVLIDDLDVNCLIHKYVDDTTLSEVILTPHQPSNMQHYFQQLLAWSTANDMDVNFDKTKEMVFGPPSLAANISLLSSSHWTCKFSEIFGHSWSSHDEAVLPKATHWLFLKQLRWAGLPPTQLVHFYLAVIRPLMH